MTDRAWWTPAGIIARSLAMLARVARRARNGDAVLAYCMLYGVTDIFGILGFIVALNRLRKERKRARSQT